MPTSRSAKKSFRQSEARRQHNLKRKKAYKAATKTALASGTSDSISTAYKAIDKARRTGILKKKDAARKKSRLVKAINRKAN